MDLKFVVDLKSSINYMLKILFLKIEWNAFLKSCILFIFNPIASLLSCCQDKGSRQLLATVDGIIHK